MNSLLRIACLFTLALGCVWYGTAAEAAGVAAADQEFFDKYVAPVARKFAEVPGIPKGSLDLERSLLKWKFWLQDESSIRVAASLYFTNRILVDLFIKDTNCVVVHFRDSRFNPHIIAAPDSSREKARFFAQQKDTFTEESALSFATEFLKQVGHDPENFRLDRRQHLGWGDPEDKTSYLQLPFYEFEWLRKDVKEVKPGEAHHPTIWITLSGLSRSVVSYSRLNLPICGDFDDCAK